MVLFSIIIATFNSANTLERTLKSIISQDFEDFEIVIIDGGSIDDTMKIVDAYATYIKIKISEKDQGIYDAWNKGLKVATGEWISFLGSDDIFYPNSLKAYADYIKKKRGNLDYVSSRVNLLNTDGHVLRTIGKAWNWNKFRSYMCVAHVGSMHHTSLYQRYGSYDISYKITGDYEFLLRPGANLRTGFLDKLTVGMQVGGVSTSFSVYRETYRAKIDTGHVPKIVAIYDWIVAVGIFFGRKIIKS